MEPCDPNHEYPTPIENSWKAPKARARQVPHWDDTTTRELAEEGWASLSQATISEWVHSMPQRLQDCVDNDGKMTGY